MRKLATIAFAAAMLLGFHVTAKAGGTAEQAKALVDKAVALIASEGKDKAFAEIDDPKGPFVQGDLYVFVNDMSGTTVAHGVNKALIGKNLKGLKDADGKSFVEEMISLTQTKGEGWVDYKWPDPVTKKIEAKSSYIKKAGDVFVGCGIYKG